MHAYLRAKTQLKVEKMVLKFSSPVRFKISEDEEVIFDSVEQCHGWAESEIGTWTTLRDKWAQNPLHAKKYRFDFESQIQPFRELYSLCTEAMSKAQSDEYISLIIDKLNNIKNKLCVVSDSTLGTSIIAVSEEDILLALTTACAFNPNFYVGNEWLSGPIGNTTTENKTKLTALIKGFANALILEKNPSLSSSGGDALRHAIRAARSSKKKFEENIEKQSQFIERGEQQLSGISQKALEQHDGITERFEAFTASAKAEIAALKTEIALHEPIRYWADEFTRCKNAAENWVIAFFVGVVLTFFSLLSIMHSLVHMGYLDLKAPNIEAVAIFLLMPLFFLVWILKLIAKRYQTNFHLMNDAKNREVMTKAFLALMAGKHANDKEKILILSALFRPAPNMKYDDGAPVHWFDLVLEKMKEGDRQAKGMGIES